MKKWSVIWALIVLAVPGLAQDSVSKNLGNLPGDALSPWNTGHQCAEYVVDLTPFTASWGTQFAVGPLVKAGKSSTAGAIPPAKEYFNSQLSAQGISRRQSLGVGYPASTYKFWTVPGQGVHPTMNNPPGTLSPTGSGNQFAVSFAEFGTTDNNRAYNGIVGAVVNYDPVNPTRLYVKRVTAAINGANPDENRSQFGIGAVDDWGNVIFRADGNQCTGPNTLTGNNVFAVDVLARSCGLLNVIDNAGIPNAGTWFVRQSGTTHNTPNIGPESIFGQPYFLGTNYNNQYGYGAAYPPTYTSGHLAAGVTDHRGNLSYMTKNHSCVGGTHGTAAILGKKGSSAPTDTINLWGLGPTGNVVGTPLALTLPTTIVDHITGMTNMSGTNEFDHYHSQVAFRGGNGQIGLNIDQAGRLLAAAVVYQPEVFNNNPLNYIAAARVGASCTVEWGMVAYSCDQYGNPNSGKPILNGPGGAAIGRLVGLYEVTGGTPLGPSMSAPMIDSVGNVWFISAMRWFGPDGIEGTQDDDLDSALIRAVYKPAVFGWELELVLELGMVFPGQNSGRPWTIAFMGVADADSVSSGTAWSANISEMAHLGATPSPTLDTKDPTTLGGLVLNTKILYDANADGTYNDPTSTYYNPNLPADEAYDVLLYVGATKPGVPPICVGDMNCDGQVSFADINPFVIYMVNFAAWQSSYPGCNPRNGDINGDGTYPSFADVNPFVALLTTNPLPIDCP